MARRIIKVWLGAAGIGYLAVAAFLAWFIVDGTAIRANPVCAPFDLALLTYWTCETGPFKLQLLANAANAVLTLSIWSPILIAAAFQDPGAWASGLTLLGFHVVGLPAAFLVLWWTGRALLRRVA